jgi:soluble lytic murein transglycosylase-like protein
MGDTRGPVRHRRASRRSAAAAGDGDGADAPLPMPGDLQDVFTALARRVKLPTAPEATPRSVLRTAGLPLLMATVVTGTQTLPAEVALAASPAPQAAPARKLPVKPAPAKKPPVKKPAAKKAAAKKAAARTAPPATRRYVVVQGDTLIDICTEHKVNLAGVLTLNHLRKDSIIRPGQKLLLPAPPAKANPGSTFLGRSYPPRVVAAANANRRLLARRKVPSRAQVRAMITTAARRRDLDPALVLAVAYQESGFNQRVVSPANAVGVMQVIPSAGKWASDLIDSPLDLLNTRDNITAGIVLLAALSKATGSEAQAIAGYYQGLTSVRNNGMFDDTRRYVANVQTLKSRFSRTV